MTNNSKKHGLKWQNVIILSLLFVSLAGIIYGGANLIMWVIDNNTIGSEISEIEEEIEVGEVDDSEETEIVEPEETLDEFNPYWDYIKMKLIDVDFGELKSINSDASGWIQVGGTNINYPFVQGADNEYYLHHSFYKNYNQAGWVFLDYRNTGSFNDKNTIIYGHALTAGSMFGTLKNILEPSWQNNTDNHIVRISTEKESTLWQVFSIYTISVTSDYLQTEFRDDAEFMNFVEVIGNRSVHDFSTLVSKNDRILTLSSCYINSDNRVVLHAKLIKRQKKASKD